MTFIEARAAVANTAAAYRAAKNAFRDHERACPRADARKWCPDCAVLDGAMQNAEQAAQDAADAVKAGG